MELYRYFQRPLMPESLLSLEASVFGPTVALESTNLQERRKARVFFNEIMFIRAIKVEITARGGRRVLLHWLAREVISHEK